jgi:hypothetical protein
MRSRDRDMEAYEKRRRLTITGDEYDGRFVEFSS